MRGVLGGGFSEKEENTAAILKFTMVKRLLRAERGHGTRSTRNSASAERAKSLKYLQIQSDKVERNSGDAMIFDLVRDEVCGAPRKKKMKALESIREKERCSPA